MRSAYGLGFARASDKAPRGRCNRLQRLHEFEGRKRTCSARLAHHNARRRARHHEKAKQARDGEDDAADPEAAAPLRTSKRAAAVRAAAVIRRHNLREGCEDGEDGGSSEEEEEEPEAAPAKRAALGPERPVERTDVTLEHALAGGDFDIADFFQLDAPQPLPPPPVLQPPLQPPALGMPHYPSAAAAAVSMPFQWWSAGSALDTLRAADAASAAVPALLHVKLPGAHPQRLPSGLPAAFTAAFGAGAPLALSAAIRPGCVLLSIDALLAADGAAAGALGADVALARLRSAPGAAGDFFRSQLSMSVHAPGTSCEVATIGSRGYAPADRLPPLAPLAALCGTPVTVELAASAGGKVRAGPLHCRLHGNILALAARSRVPTGALGVLEPCAEEGCALIEASPADASTAAERAAAPRPLLLCADAAIVAEVCAAAVAAGDDAGARDAAERVVCVLGAALRPGAGVEVLAAACAAAATLGWTASLARLLPSLLRAAAEAAAPRDDTAAVATACTRGGVTLLHRAAAAGADAACAALLAAGGAGCAFGAPGSAGPGGVTPLHLAAALRDGGSLVSTLMAPARAGPERSGDALWAWFRAADAGGRTPAHVSEAADGSAATEQLRALLGARRDAARSLALRHLRELEAEGHLAPQLAALAALDALAAVPGPAAADAAAMFRAASVAASAHDAAVAAADAATAAAAQAAAASRRAAELAAADAAERRFCAWQATRGRLVFVLLCFLYLVKSVGNSLHCYSTVLTQDEASYANILAVAPRNARLFFEDTSLHTVDGSSSTRMIDMTFDRMCVGCVGIMRASLGMRLPLAVSGLALTVTPRLWAWALPRYEPIFLFMSVMETLIYAYIDVVTIDVSGGLMPEWPAKTLLLRALLAAFCWLVGPFRSGPNRLLWLVRLLSGSGLCLALHAPLRQRLWLNPGYCANLALLAAESVLENWNQRRLRRAHAAHEAAALVARKKQQ